MNIFINVSDNWHVVCKKLDFVIYQQKKGLEIIRVIMNNRCHAKLFDAAKKSVFENSCSAGKRN